MYWNNFELIPENSFLFSDFDNLQKKFDDLFYLNQEYLDSNRGPGINGWVNDSGIKLVAEIPGVDPKTISISIENDTLYLKGSYSNTELKEGEEYHRHERDAGSFTRKLNLPFRIDTGKVDATSKDGLLTIDLPRLEQDKPRRIEVKAA